MSDVDVSWLDSPWRWIGTNGVKPIPEAARMAKARANGSGSGDGSEAPLDRATPPCLLHYLEPPATHLCLFSDRP